MADASVWRAGAYLAGFTLRRQLRGRQTVWASAVLVGLAVAVVGVLAQATQGWTRTMPPRRFVPVETAQLYANVAARPLLATPAAGAAQDAFVAAVGTAHTQRNAFSVFTRNVVFGLFLAYLLPLICLSYAAGAFGTERETRTLIWLLTRPLPRPAVYLARLAGVLPWSLGLSLAAFAAVCLVSGPAGQRALLAFWPAVLAGALAFSALFFLVGAVCPWPTVVCVLYSFFFEVIVAGFLPGGLQRASVTFYVRSLVSGAAGDLDLSPLRASGYQPVTPAAAWTVLLLLTVGLTALGAWWFARREYREES